MTKREAKKLALRAAATLCEQATETEIFMNGAYTDAEVDMLRSALDELREDLFRRAAR